MRYSLNFIDSFLNSITMYKLVTYGLGIISAYAIILGFAGKLIFATVDGTIVSPLNTGILMIASLTLLLIICEGGNRLLAHYYHAPRNAESAAITAFILFCILQPITQFTDVLYFLAAAVMAMLSKFLLAKFNRHLFNPAAISAFILSTSGSPLVTWWVGSAAMIPVTLIVGLLIVRKIRRFNLFLSFLGTSVVVLSIITLLNDSPTTSFATELWDSFLSWPIIFLGTIMLTEPVTTPPTFKTQIAYGAIVGFLMPVTINIGAIHNTAEFALVVGNVCSYIWSTKRRYVLSLIAAQKISEQIYNFTFKTPEKLTFKPGQYAEWTIHDETPDSRGNRRYFTIASAPSESIVNLGVRIFPQGSSFKNKLLEMKPHQHVVLGSIAGDFVLPQDQKQKLVFIAGGVGVTPFRSMIKYITDLKQNHDIVLLYAANAQTDFAYTEIFAAAEALGVKTKYLITNKPGIVTVDGTESPLDEKLVAQLVPDFADRHFYISGPNAMVTGYKKIIKKLGVNNAQIKTDYFPGF